MQWDYTFAWDWMILVRSFTVFPLVQSHLVWQVNTCTGSFVGRSFWSRTHDLYHRRSIKSSLRPHNRRQSRIRARRESLEKKMLPDLRRECISWLLSSRTNSVKIRSSQCQQQAPTCSLRVTPSRKRSGWRRWCWWWEGTNDTLSPTTQPGSSFCLSVCLPAWLSVCLPLSFSVRVQVPRILELSIWMDTKSYWLSASTGNSNVVMHTGRFGSSFASRQCSGSHFCCRRFCCSTTCVRGHNDWWSSL